jgi:exodeoxyribonuclease-3
VSSALGSADFDAEGRWVQADFGRLSVVSLYVPSGTSGPERQAVKMQVLDRLIDRLGERRRSGRHVLVCGDFNIAHRPIDIENWRGNQHSSGFLPEERAWMDRLFGPVGWVDVFRQLNPNPREYTWWSNRGRAREKNVGWRIDYQVATPALAALARRCSVYRTERFSDHAPVTVDYQHAIPV